MFFPCGGLNSLENRLNQQCHRDLVRVCVVCAHRVISFRKNRAGKIHSSAMRSDVYNCCRGWNPVILYDLSCIRYLPKSTCTKLAKTYYYVIICVSSYDLHLYVFVLQPHSTKPGVLASSRDRRYCHTFWSGWTENVVLSIARAFRHARRNRY